MELKPNTKTVTYRYYDITLPNKTLSLTLTEGDWFERTEDAIHITFAKGNTIEIPLANVLAIEFDTITRELPIDTDKRSTH